MYSRTLVSITLMALALIAASNPLPEGDLVKKELKQFNARDTIDSRANRPRPSPRPSKALVYARETPATRRKGSPSKVARVDAEATVEVRDEKRTRPRPSRALREESAATPVLDNRAKRPSPRPSKAMRDLPAATPVHEKRAKPSPRPSRVRIAAAASPTADDKRVRPKPSKRAEARAPTAM